MGPDTFVVTVLCGAPRAVRARRARLRRHRHVPNPPRHPARSRCRLRPRDRLDPRFGLPVIDRSSLQLVASPSLSIGEHVHPDDGPVLVLVEYRIAPEDVDGFLSAMAELRIVRRRLGATRWGVFQDVTVYGKFLETFLVPSWQSYLLQRAHYTKADIETEARAFAFHREPGEPKFTRLVHPDTVEAANARVCLATGNAPAAKTVRERKNHESAPLIPKTAPAFPTCVVPSCTV